MVHTLRIRWIQLPSVSCSQLSGLHVEGCSVAVVVVAVELVVVTQLSNPTGHEWLPADASSSYPTQTDAIELPSVPMHGPSDPYLHCDSLSQSNEISMPLPSPAPVVLAKAVVFETGASPASVHSLKPSAQVRVAANLYCVQMAVAGSRA